MRNKLLLILLTLCSYTSLAQVSDEDLDFEYSSKDFISKEHSNYLKEQLEITKFDSTRYHRLVEAMRLKSKGRIYLDLDRIDPNFNPEDYLREDSTFIYGDWYGGGEYIQDWDDYYYEEYEEYERINQEDYKEVERIDYDKLNDPEKAKEKEKKKKEKQEPGSMSVWLIIFMGLVLALVIGYLFFSGPTDTEVKKENIDDLTPTEIPKSELELMLESALAKEDYRKAIRIYFIFIMKDLSEKGWINWQKKKTNLLYIREMRDKPYYELFNKCVSVYEVAWYGKRTIDKADFDSVEPIFQQLLNNLERHK